MIPISPTLIGAAAAGVLILGLGAAVKVQSSRLETCKTEHAAFVDKVKTVGEAQEAAAKLTDEQNKTRMEKANAENARTKSALAIALNSLRSQRPSSGFVSAAPATSSRPDLACYDRADLGGTIGKVVDGVRAIADECTAATVDLNTAKAWAQSKP